ncbi:MAG: peptidase M3 [Ignavibacteriae bacterium]|nr:peptidase M3 [Ignavibacteriota bacterium]MCB9215108.1 peptidase M3 [Ignavibacteria bacterium]
MTLLQELNNRYIQLHVAKEEAFWVEKMGLAGSDSAGFEEKEIALKEFCSSPEYLRQVREALSDTTTYSTDEMIALQGWERFFIANQIEGDEAKAIARELVGMEGKLERERGKMALGYTDPESKEFVEASSVALALRMRTAREEGMRKSAFEGLRSIEPFVLDHGFLDIVRKRNQLARMIGYEDYYDWKVSINEGFGKKRLFEILDDLEEKTREACRRSIEELKEKKGESAAQPWNFSFYTSGDLSTELDPYFPFEDSFTRWGRSFAALGISYGGATMQLDLVDRKGKYSNGFMHGPSPAWVEDGRLHPARINFTANALPGQVGSGQRASETFFHEGGHAAHFSNIRMPAPCFAQEFAPTSVALAETQSMFLDSLLKDPDWMARYAKDTEGEDIPKELIYKNIEKESRYRAWRLRSMLAVSYAEKALYEMSEEELTPENVLSTFRSIESDMLMMPANPRPLLSIPHLLSGEASAYYHGYTLAEMAVYQTRDYFTKKYGYITDNPNVGPELREVYWKPGNSKTFLEFVEALTGEPFSARATAELVNKSVEEAMAEADRMIEREKDIPHYNDMIDLDATIAVVHGDETVATTAEGLSFEEVGEKFREWVRSL